MITQGAILFLGTDFATLYRQKILLVTTRPLYKPFLGSIYNSYFCKPERYAKDAIRRICVPLYMFEAPMKTDQLSKTFYVSIYKPTKICCNTKT